MSALKRTSENHNLKVRDLARALVDAHEERRLEAELSRYGLAR